MFAHNRDKYNLRLTFPSQTKTIGFVDDIDADYAERRKMNEMTNKTIRKLARRTSTLRNELERRQDISHCLEEMTKLMDDTTPPDEIIGVLFTFPLAFANHPEITGDKRLCLESELQDIEKWLPEVCTTNARLMGKLRRLNDTISSNDRSPPLTLPRGAAPVDVLYRLNHTAKASRYDKDLGVLCPGWSPPHTAPLPANAESFRNYFTSDDRSASPFISVSESPGRILNFRKSLDCASDELEVLVIDAEKLRQFGVQCQRSTEWARDLEVSSPGSYVIDSQWLVERWIPKDCIKVVVKFKDFEDLCKVKHIISGEFQLER